MSNSASIKNEISSHFFTFEDNDQTFQLHYNDTEAGEDVVIMLHGSGPGATSWANFYRNVEPLSKAGYRVILLDFPGWGKSDPVICSSSRSELNGRAVKGLMDALNISCAHLIGNSMGAHSAVSFSLNNPGRTKKMVLMGGGTGGPSQFVPMPTEGIKLIQQLYRNPTIENLKKMMAVFVYDASSMTDELYEARLQNILSRKDHLENFVKSAQANPKQFSDYGPRLSEISSPTLIIWGRDDRFVPMDVGLRLLWGLQDAELHLFSKCGHWAQWEHAEKFNQMVLNFLTR